MGPRGLSRLPRHIFLLWDWIAVGGMPPKLPKTAWPKGSLGFVLETLSLFPMRLEGFHGFRKEMLLSKNLGGLLLVSPNTQKRSIQKRNANAGLPGFLPCRVWLLTLSTPPSSSKSNRIKEGICINIINRFPGGRLLGF